MFIVLLLLRNSPGFSPFRSLASGVPYLTVCLVFLFRSEPFYCLQVLLLYFVSLVTLEFLGLSHSFLSFQSSVSYGLSRFSFCSEPFSCLQVLLLYFTSFLSLLWNFRVYSGFLPFRSGVPYLGFVLPFALLERRGAFTLLLNRLRRTDSFFISQIFYKSLYDLKDFVYRLQRIAGFL